MKNHRVKIFLSEWIIYLPVYFIYENKELTKEADELKNEYKSRIINKDKLGWRTNLRFLLKIKVSKLHNNLNLEILS